MNSIIDQQLELVPCRVVLSEQEIRQRVVGIFEYIEEIIKSDRTKERKLELVTSSIELLTTIALQCPNDSLLRFLIPISVASLPLRIQSLHRPLPNLEMGSPAVVGEEGMELMIDFSGARLNIPVQDSIQFPIVT